MAIRALLIRAKAAKALLQGANLVELGADHALPVHDVEKELVTLAACQT